MTAAAATTAAPARQVRTRRWWRWPLRLLVAVVVLRVLLGLFLPQLLALVAGFFGLSLAVQGTSLSLLGLSFRAEHLVVGIADRPDAPPLLTAQDVAVDLSTRSLLAGDIVVVDAALARARITVLRGRDGKLVLPAGWLDAAPAPPPEPESEPAEPFRFELPAVVTSARLHDVQLRFIDAGTEPPLHAEATIDFDATDLGDRGKPGTLLLRAYSPVFFDEAFLQARIVATGDRADVEWQAAMHGLRPHKLPIRLDLPPAAFGRQVTIDAEGKLNGETRADAPRMPAVTASVDVNAALGAGEHATIALRAGPLALSAEGEDVLPFTVATAFPGVVQALRLDGGELTQRDGTTSVRGSVAIERLTLAVLATELRARGITLPDGGLDVSARFDAELGTGITGSLHDAVIAGGGESLRLARASVNDLRSDGDGLAIGAVTIDGPVAAARRDADGTVVAAGVRVAPLPAAAAPAPPPSAPAPPFSLPKVRLGSLAWTGAACTITDATVQPPATLAIGDVDVRGDSLTIGANAPPGRISVGLRIDDAIESLRADVALTPAATSLAAEVEVRANGVTAGALAPWLLRAGFAPALRAGDLRLLAAANVAIEPGGAKVSARLADLRFRDGDEVLLSVRNVTGTDLRLGGGAADFGTWRIDEPFLAVHKNASGALHVAGLQQVAPTGARAAAATPVPPPAAAAVPAATAPPGLPTLPKLHLTVDRAVLRWSVPDTPPCSIGVDAVVNAGGATSPVTLASTLRIDGALHEARFTGTLTPGDGWQFDAEVAANGMRGAGFAALLPPNARCTLNDGALQARLTAHVHVGRATGVALQLDALQLTDNGEEIAAIDHLRLDAPEVGADRTHISKLEGRGLRALATETPGGLHLPGLLLTSSPGVAAATRAEAPGHGPADASSPSSAAPTSLRLPVFAIDELSLDCERIVVRERLATDGEPLVITGKLTMAPWAPDLEQGEPAPATLTLLASASPVCKELRAHVTVNPYELEPSAEVVLAGALDLTAIPRISPRLGEFVQGLTAAAEFSATMHARLHLHRRDARTVDPGRPFGAELTFEKIVFRDAASGATYASIDMLDVDARAIDPGAGDIMLRSIDIDGAALGVTRTAEGFELLGMRVKLPESPPPVATPAATRAPVAAAPEFSVDRVSVQGAAVTVTDASTTPPTLLPFSDVEASLKGFSTRAFTDVRPFAFSLTMHGGDLALPKRTVYASVLGGVLSSATQVVTFSGDRQEIEQRPLVDEITIAGQVQFVPFLRGQLRTRVVDFELTSLCGIAKRSGVDIGDGVVNHRSTIDIRGPDGTHLTANTAFTHLSLSETSGGPISTYLRLPAPLDTVLFLLKNDADEHRLPIEATVPTDKLGGGALAQAAVDAVTQLIADAVASAPTRALSTVTDPFGNFLGIGGASTFVPVSAEVPFAPADPLPAAVDLQAILDALADQNVEVVLTHELGQGDLPRAARLATPPAEVRAATVDRLVARRAEMDAVRCELAAEVAALYAAGRMQEAWVKQENLVAQDNRLGELEQTLDQALNMLAGDTPHAARRRTLAAAQALGNARLGVVRDRLLKLAPGLTDDRVFVRPARGAVTELPEGGRVITTARRRTVQ